METYNNTNNNIVIAEKTVKNIFGYIDDQNIAVSIEEDIFTQTPRIHVKAEDPRLFIGQNGANLSALTHIVKRIVEQDLNESEKHVGTRFILDVNDYQKKKTEALKAKIILLADRARSFKSSVELDPMSSYERMLVHSMLADESNLITESEGEGRARRVVIKYSESEQD